MLVGVLSLVLPLAMAEPEAQQGRDPVLERIEALEAERARDKALMLQYEVRLREMEGGGGGNVSALPDPIVAEPVVIEAGEQVSEIVAWGPVSVRGEVQGRAVSFGGNVRVFDGAKVRGDAVSFGGQVRVDPGAVVQGDRISYASTTQAPSISESPLNQGGNWIRRITRKLVLILSLAGAGVVLTGLFPSQVERVSETLQERPLSHLAWGVMAVTLGGLLMVALSATIIGIPIAALIPIVVGVAWLLGIVAMCQLVGETLPFEGAKSRRWAGFLAGVVLLSLVGLLPWVGQLILCCVSLAGIGAALRSRMGTQDI
ncbi:MAG: cytoskeletal protein CcmA (bactofilin family) [Cognaticolwellia sp.]